MLTHGIWSIFKGAIKMAFFIVKITGFVVTGAVKMAFFIVKITGFVVTGAVKMAFFIVKITGFVVTGAVKMAFFIVKITGFVVRLILSCLNCLVRFLHSQFTISRKKNPANNHAPPFAVVPDSQVEIVMMEKFLNDMASEKPMRFSPHQLVGFTNNFSIKLGSGGFGVVFKGTFPNGVQIAVKVLNGDLDKRVEEQFMAEISTIGRTYHINLVRLYGFCFDVSMRALVYEYMENGSLDTILFRKNPRMEWEKLQVIAIGTAKGIAYLHEECEHRIIHYDIKPGNVLLDGNFSPKVADFGLAKLCDRDRTHITMTGGRGTPGYAAPELWILLPITHKCDVYSFGMMLFEIVGRRRNLDVDLSESQEWFPRWVWKKFEDGELKEMITSNEIEEDRRSMERMAMVALWCVQYLPDSRPPMSSVVKMLEGGSEILPPPNPFQHLFASSASMLWCEIESGSNSTFVDTSCKFFNTHEEV